MVEKPWARVHADPDAEAQGLIAGTQQGHPTSLESNRQLAALQGGGWVQANTGVGVLFHEEHTHKQGLVYRAGS